MQHNIRRKGFFFSVEVLLKFSYMEHLLWLSEYQLSQQYKVLAIFMLHIFASIFSQGTTSLEVLKYEKQQLDLQV